MFLTARVEADRENRLAHIDSVNIENLVLEGAKEEEIGNITAAIEKSVSDFQLSMSYDRFIAALNAGDHQAEAESGINNTPPEIIVKNVPSVLVTIDGKAKLRAIENTDLLYVENSAFPIVLDPKTKSYFLNGGQIWYKASAVEGPWTYTKTQDVPPYVSETLKLSDEQMKALDEKMNSDDQEETIPEIVTTFKPAELIVINGKVEYTPLVGAELLYVSNSETPILQMVGSKDIYVLLSGRWFKSTSLGVGGWEYVASDKLPEVFAKIPEDSDRADALSHIAGTDQAQEAVINATVPQVTAIKRDKVDFNPKYNGEPEFTAINGTKVEYAINTSSTVLRIAGKYYAVDQGVWYVSDKATGPWSIAEEVPEEVNAIPASSPVHNVKYVRIYDSTPEYVYVGYTPGYLGSYIYHGVVVYGTGYYYPLLYPRYYYPRPITWGFGAYYRPWYGWGFGIGYGRFYYRSGFRAGVAVGIGIGLRHNRWFGPGGYHTYRGVARRTARRTTYRTRNNIYNRTGNRNRNYFKNTRTATRTNNLTINNNRVRINNKSNNVFTDKSGNVLRKTDKGWQSRQNGKWKDANLGTKLPAKPTIRPVKKAPAKPAARPGAQKAKPATRAARPAQKTRSRARTAPKRSQSKQMTRQSNARNRGNANRLRSRQASRSPKRRSSGRGGRRRR